MTTRTLLRCEFGVPTVNAGIITTSPCSQPAVSKWTLDDGSTVLACKQHDLIFESWKTSEERNNDSGH